MSIRLKRTYNLSEATLRQVRELAGEYGVAKSQDAVVELAVDRLYAQMRDIEEADAWARAAQDAGFQAEMEEIAQVLRDTDTWPR